MKKIYQIQDQNDDDVKNELKQVWILLSNYRKKSCYFIKFFVFFVQILQNQRRKHQHPKAHHDTVKNNIYYLCYYFSL